MKRFVFQGDSITDAGRDRNNIRSLGPGYAGMVAADMLYKYPGEYEFINQGISGNRIVDVYARIKSDIINLKPDYLSILIGVNDVWHELDCSNGVDTAKFKKIYSMLIEEIMEALPNVKIFILEPFVLNGSDTEKYYDAFRSGVEEKSTVAREIAEQYGLHFIPLQNKFDEAFLKVSDTSYWTTDGVHARGAGNKIIANELIKCFEENRI